MIQISDHLKLDTAMYQVALRMNPHTLSCATDREGKSKQVLCLYFLKLKMFHPNLINYLKNKPVAPPSIHHIQIDISQRLITYSIFTNTSFNIWKHYSFPEWSSLSRTDFTIMSTDHFSEVMSRQQMLEFKTLHETFNPLHLYIPWCTSVSPDLLKD